jgi:glycosyltransferase involved in cell wall biosynthesis
VPVIAPNVGGPPELVRNDVNGYTFTPGDVTGLAAILQRIAIDPSALNALRDAIIEPPRIEEESFAYDRVYRELAL